MKSLGLRRLFTLKVRFKREPKFHKDCMGFMKETIQNCVENVSLEDRISNAIGEGTINYVPHHGIYHPKNISV